MKRHVNKPTQARGHTLDVVITQEVDTTVSMVEVTEPGLTDRHGKVSCDHLTVIFKAYAFKAAPVRRAVSFRKLRSIDVENDSFKRDIQNTNVFNDSLSFNDAEELNTAYNNELSSLVEKAGCCSKADKSNYS